MSRILLITRFILVSLLFGGVGVVLDFVIISHVDLTDTGGKSILVPAVFFAISSWWFSVLWRAQDLKKFDTLASIEQEIFDVSLRNVVRIIWAMILFNIVGALVSVLASLMAKDVLLGLPLTFLVFFFLIESFAFLSLMPVVSNRIENAKSALAKREKEEKDREEVIKEMRKVANASYEKSSEFDKYHQVLETHQNGLVHN